MTGLTGIVLTSIGETLYGRKYMDDYYKALVKAWFQCGIRYGKEHEPDQIVVILNGLTDLARLSKAIDQEIIINGETKAVGSANYLIGEIYDDYRE